MNWKSVIFVGLRIIISCVLIGMILHYVDFNKVSEALRSLDVISFVFLFCAILASLLVFVFAGRVWNVLFPKFLIWEMVLLNMKVFSISLLLPSRTGDFGYVYYLRKKGIDLKTGFAGFLFERLVYLAFITLCAVVGLFWYFADKISWLFLIVGIVVFFLVLYLLFVFGLRMLSWGLKRFFHKEVDFVGLFKIFSLKQLGSVALWNFFRWSSRAAIFYYLFSAFGQNIPFYGIFLLISIEVFLTILPLTIAGLGARELFAIWAYPLLFGVSADVTLLVYVFAMVLSYLEGIIIMLTVKVEQ